MYFTDNVRLARSPQSQAERLQTPNSDSDHSEINISPPNGHARQQDVNPDEEPIILDSRGEVANDSNSVAKVDHRHSELEHAFDSIGEDDEDIDVARFLHSFGDDDDYEYEIDIDIEKTEYKFT